MHLAIRLANHQGVTKLLRSSDKEKEIKSKEKSIQYVQRNKDNDDSGFYLSLQTTNKQNIMEDGSQWSNIFKVLEQKTETKQSPISRDFSTHRRQLSKFKAK